MARHPVCTTPAAAAVQHLSAISQRPEKTIRIDLEEPELWRVFSDGVMNEMIITKSGRKLYPVVRLKIRGLDTKRMYKIVMDFEQKGHNRWKYSDGGWSHAGKADPQPAQTSYVHTRSPNYGSFWMSESIDFEKIKVSNKPVKNMFCAHLRKSFPNHSNFPMLLEFFVIQLNSLHLYQPHIRVFLMETSDEAELGTLVADKILPECAFMAVTSYQNQDVTQLKIKHNPFAKGFAKDENGKRIGSADSYGSPKVQSPVPTAPVYEEWPISFEVMQAQAVNGTGPYGIAPSKYISHRYAPYSRPQETGRRVRQENCTGEYPSARNAVSSGLYGSPYPYSYYNSYYGNYEAQIPNPTADLSFSIKQEPGYSFNPSSYHQHTFPTDASQPFFYNSWGQGAYNYGSNYNGPACPLAEVTSTTGAGSVGSSPSDLSSPTGSPNGTSCLDEQETVGQGKTGFY